MSTKYIPILITIIILHTTGYSSDFTVYIDRPDRIKYICKIYKKSQSDGLWYVALKYLK